ncbi:MAG: STAS domain-containing protein [Leptospira sp.]|nr:STAS domain-containing protein [Leptospira sp.]
MNANMKNKTKIIRFQGAILRRDAESMEAEFSNTTILNSSLVVLDFTRVHHICSSALGVLVSFKRKIRNKNGELKLVIDDEDLLQVFEITMLDKVFDIFQTVEEAVADKNIES